VLIGFEEIKTQLIQAYNLQKLPHAILLNGKEGIGKSLFAKEFSREILKNNFSDLLIIEKDEGKREINVDKIRKISNFVNQTSAGNNDKFIIIDAASELNKSASNALLKILEEPNQKNFLILISHNLNQILPTIRSRCQIVKINNHNFQNFSKIIEKNINFSLQEKEFLAEIFNNSPAQVINFGAQTSRFYQLFLRSILNKQISEELLKTIADKNFNFAIFENIFHFLIARLIKNFHQNQEKFFFEEEIVFTKLKEKFSLAEIFNINDEISQNLNKVSKLYLDKKLALINIFNRISLK
jgi:DNA polymerase-3 subunit delta'